jgi:hypothetical protein
MVCHWSNYNNDNEVKLEKVKEGNLSTYKERSTEGIRKQ